MVLIRPKRFPKHSFKKHFAQPRRPYPILKRLAPMHFSLTYPLILSISPIFNVEDLIEVL